MSKLTSPRSEDILANKTDLCLSNAIVKGGLGLGAGILASAILFKRRPFPVLLGLGFGLGQSYSDCERIFNPAQIPGFKISESLPSAVESSFPLFESLKKEVVKDVQAVKELVVEATSVTEEKIEKVEKKIETKKRLV